MSSTAGDLILTMSDGRVLKGTAKDGVFTYTSDEPLEHIDVQVTVNTQPGGRCHRTKKAKKT